MSYSHIDRFYIHLHPLHKQKPSEQSPPLTQSQQNCTCNRAQSEFSLFITDSGLKSPATIN